MEVKMPINRNRIKSKEELIKEMNFCKTVTSEAIEQIRKQYSLKENKGEKKPLKELYPNKEDFIKVLQEEVECSKCGKIINKTLSMCPYCYDLR
jgi:nitrogenase subunit NifH